MRRELPAVGLCQRGLPHLAQSYSIVMFKQAISDPLVDKVKLLQANPQNAHIRHADERETTVSI